jgi:uncharacterized protein YjbI with pentapeptide repeats
MSADLSDVDLSQADLSGADLIFADLSGTDLRGADLSGTNLSFANLSGHNLNFADLSGAFLSEADLSGAILNGANFSEAVIESTSFGDVDLSVVKNLETATHNGPSTIGIDTIYRSEGKIPEVFLRNAGVPDSFIVYMRSLVGNPIDYYSCFISYSNKDQAFAERLHADLQSPRIAQRGY